MSTTIAASSMLNPLHRDAQPLHGNLTHEASMHLQLAAALSTILCGVGAESFNTYADDIRDDVLFLLSCEISRARQALDAESGLSSKEASA